MTIVARESVSQRFIDAIMSSSYTIATRADILMDGEVVESDIEIFEGSVDMESNNSSRRRFDLLLHGREVIAGEHDHIADAIHGHEIQISRGVRFPDGEEELVSLGVFRVDDVEIEDTGADLATSVSGQDRSAAISDAKFEEPYSVPSGTLFTDAILTLIQYVYPDIDYNFATSTVTTPDLIAEAGDDRWEFAQGLATAIGGELFFDADGIPTLQPVPTPSSPYVTLAEGEGGALIGVGKAFSRAGKFNRAIVTGDNSGGTDTVRGVATDEDPSSPTYYYGSYGKVPEFFSSEFVTTSTQAEDMALGLLTAQKGSAHAITFDAFVDPRLGPGDGVLVTRERIGVNELHVVDSLGIPLDTGGSMTGQTRVVQIEV